MRDQGATGKIQRNNYRHGSCGPSLTGKTSSVSLIFTHGTHRNVKNRQVKSGLKGRFPLGEFSARNDIFFCLLMPTLRQVHVQNFWGGWQAVSLGGGVTVMEKRKFWQGG